jgi:uncharacterized membrane protein (DUF4010 family)
MTTLIESHPIFLVPSLTDKSMLLGFCVALGIGLLIGAERERRKGSGIMRGSAGIRTFAATSMLGAVGVLLGGVLLIVATLIVGALAVVSYQRTRDNDPGITTEISLLLTCLLGGLAMHHAALAAGIGAALALLLAARNRIHFFVRGVLTERELHDALLFFAAALILLPLAPDRFMGPFDALNPHSIARLVVLVMAISAIGYVAMRSLGVRYGLPLAGFSSGFISSTATIHTLGLRAARSTAHAAGAAAGAVLSTVATIIQMGLVVALVQPALLHELMQPLLFGGAMAVAYSLVFMLRGISASDETEKNDIGHAFDLKSAVLFAAIMSGVLLLSAALSALLGSRGTLLAAVATGLIDPHATAASVASLVTANKLSVQDALWPILAGLTTNTLMKAIVAFNAGGAQYAARIVPGLVLVIAATWAGALLGQLV